MLIDANLLVYSIDEESPFNARASRWIADQLAGPVRVGIPWASIGAFIRITTNPRAMRQPLAPADAWSYVEEWLAADPVWIPGPTDRHADVFGGLVQRYRTTGNLVTDAHLAAIAIEHGLELCSTDGDFARFAEVRWRNPLVEAAADIDLTTQPTSPPEPEEPD